MSYFRILKLLNLTPKNMDRQEIKILINYLENNRKHLNSLQHEFITSVKENYKTTGVITPRQVECLYAMKEYIPSIVLTDAESVHESEPDKYQAQYSSFDSAVTYCL